MELLKQGQYQPQDPGLQLIILFAIDSNMIEKVPLHRTAEFRDKIFAN